MVLILVSDFIDCPDHSILAVYGKLVVGCSLMTPEGNIAYLFVHPEWSGAGIGARLLALSIQNAPVGRDLTVHVAADNPAVILYQSFGFKSEEYIVNFYEKYLAADSPLNRNALFMRLRR